MRKIAILAAFLLFSLPLLAQSQNPNPNYLDLISLGNLSTPPPPPPAGRVTLFLYNNLVTMMDSTGTMTVLGLGAQNVAANTVFAGPASGAAGRPSFRALVAADIPSTLNSTTFNGNVSIFPSGNAGGISIFAGSTNGTNPGLKLFAPNNQEGGVLAIATQAGNWSDNAQPGDIVLRATTGTLRLTTGHLDALTIDQSQIVHVMNPIDLSGSARITSLPPAGSTNSGWKLTLYGSGDSLGVANWTVALSAANWFSLFHPSNPPADNGTQSSPDSNARVSFNTADGSVWANAYRTNSRCASAASPAACGSAAAGSFVIPAGATSVTVNTTAVTANSQIFVIEDQSLGSMLGVTCNSTITSPPVVSARTAGTSFTVTISSAVTTNPACYSYLIIN